MRFKIPTPATPYWGRIPERGGSFAVGGRDAYPCDFPLKWMSRFECGNEYRLQYQRKVSLEEDAADQAGVRLRLPTPNDQTLDGQLDRGGDVELQTKRRDPVYSPSITRKSDIKAYAPDTGYSSGSTQISSPLIKSNSSTTQAKLSCSWRVEDRAGCRGPTRERFGTWGPDPNPSSPEAWDKRLFEVPGSRSPRYCIKPINSSGGVTRDKPDELGISSKEGREREDAFRGAEGARNLPDLVARLALSKPVFVKWACDQ
ncbi:hypothetical protein NMY22_g14802 [Coprinellus aureogranulatus]|nr:hypothetical protein NMY22_g14802 [Coprinellus aureogranulatus]